MTVEHNCMGEEIFVEVTGFEEVGYFFQDRDPNTPSMAGGGGAERSLTDNSPRLIRLRAMECACGSAWGVSHLPIENLELRDWVGQNTRVEIPVRGFVRRTGQQFVEWAEVPITIVVEPEAAPTPAGHPAP